MPVPTTLPAARPESPFASMRADHCGIRVPDFETAIAWYTDKLDFRVQWDWPDVGLHFAFVVPPNDAGFRIELLTGGEPTPRPAFDGLIDSLKTGGWHHLCLRVDDVDATIAELKRRDIEIIAEPFDNPTFGLRLAFFADPWRNLFEVIHPLSR